MNFYLNMQAVEDEILAWKHSDSLIWFGIKWNLVSSMGSVLDFNKAPLSSEQPTRSHCNDNQHLYIAGVKPSHAYFHLILKTVLGGSITIYTDNEGAEAQRGEMTSPRSPSSCKAESGLSLHFLPSNFILHTVHSTTWWGPSCHVAGSSWRNLHSKLPVREEPVLSWSPILAMLGVTEWMSFLRSFEMASPTIFFFSFGEL